MIDDNTPWCAPSPPPGRGLVRRRALARARLRSARTRRGGSRTLIIPALIVGALLSLWGGGWVTFAALQAAYGAIPDMHELQADSMVYDRGGRLLADLHPPGETRIPVPLGRMSPHVADAMRPRSVAPSLRKLRSSTATIAFLTSGDICSRRTGTRVSPGGWRSAMRR
ncbi:MAG TPA: hypothetical protein VFO60_00205, partial [Candidatus Dormibacteraeota bacterium]|nr:hypothetical protein [Candidatus Dormibacteraeota bacterium]